MLLKSFLRGQIKKNKGVFCVGSSDIAGWGVWRVKIAFFAARRFLQPLVLFVSFFLFLSFSRNTSRKQEVAGSNRKWQEVARNKKQEETRGWCLKKEKAGQKEKKIITGG